MNEYEWAEQFRQVWDRGVAAYKSGNGKPQTLFNRTRQRISWPLSAAPTRSSLILWRIFAEAANQSMIQCYWSRLPAEIIFTPCSTVSHPGKSFHGSAPSQERGNSAGIAWLPRLIVKAQAKLRGEMPAELMYGCGGDRPFLHGINTHLADFLRLVWAVDGDQQKVLAFVREQIKRGKA